MRIRTLLVPSLVILAVGSCRSTESPTEIEAAPAEPAPHVAAAAPAQEGAGATQAEEASAPTQAAAAPKTTGAQGTKAPAAAQGDQLGQTAEQIQRIRERQQFLASQYLQRGDQLLDQADLQGALEQFSQALEIMPSSQEARDRIHRVQSLMGDKYAQAAEGMQDSVQRETVRRAQARIASEQFVIDGDNALRQGQFDQAIEDYRRAQTILRYHPLIETDSLDEKVVEQKLQTATQMAQQAQTQKDEATKAAAKAEREKREAEQRQYRENKLRTLYAQANSAFQREQYAVAESLAEQILLLDPGNETATEMRDIARAARHQKTSEQDRRAYRENWIRTFEQLDYLGIPQTDTIQFDLDRWRKVSERQPYGFSTTDNAQKADKQAILQRLESLTIRPQFGDNGEGAPLEEVAKYLQQVTGINFLVSRKVLDELSPDETSVYLDLSERSVRKTLDLITEIRDNLAWKVEDGIVKFVTKDELTGGQVLKMYEVRDLIRPITDFPAREINIAPSGGPPAAEEELPEHEALVITEDSLDTLIRDNVARDSWDQPGNSLRISNGTMVVNQTPEVHAQIQKLLDDLREATGIMVDIESRFLKVEDNFLEDIGVDFRGLGAPGLGTNAFFNDFGDPTTQAELGKEIGSNTDLGAFYDDGSNGDYRARVENLYDHFLGNQDVLTGAGGLTFQWTYLNNLQLQMILRAVSKSERVELVTAPRVLVFNTARSNLTVTNQVAYVQDYDVEIAQGAAIADPIISVVQDGVVLDVRPVVSADRRFITLELRPTVAQLKRPIATFATSLGSSGNSVTIQLPELEISRVRTSVPMPDGGTVLLGGFKVHEQQDLRSGVPILNKIPLVSFLFERKGTFVTNRKLLILLTAHIVIPQEHEPTPAQLGRFEGVAAPR